ncbi:glycosyltransferase family 32 protein [Amorphotheca resinae ATCC 22711]|uniref:Glycosyltransferase family 32 protein n=1 Tax=Amorphotheca resinae ATCC 22711 TaxID=857342 RepID=A0A2T3BFH9_AMORE|nr:glycosyltransferase family 32 protein [Amorphotheca resinae ATCC 22711]PSS28088.1 glycosyltransferase family 32 protein [Amorphotheca resinae ATCC 22711]
MLTFRRALVAAGFLITMLFLISRTHTTKPYQEPLPPKDATEVQQSVKDEGQTKTGYAPTTPVSTSSSAKVAPAVAEKRPQPGQQLLQDLSRAPLKDRLAYQFPYDVESKFPAYIWQTWKYTPASGDFGESFRPAEASWSEKHPGFIHEVITDQVAVHLLRHLYASVPEVLEAYNSLPLPVLKADFFRYLILLARGGIYSDIDTHAIKSAADWLPDSVPREAIGLVVGIEADPDREDWAQWYSRRIQFCQWTIQAKPGHPVLRDVVANITLRTLQKKKDGSLKSFQDKNVIEFTGPAVWTDAIFDYMNDEKYFDMNTGSGNITWRDFTGMTAPKKVGDVVVLPITSFSPGVGQMGAGDYDDPMAFVMHEFEGTWKPESERHIGEETAS